MDIIGKFGTIFTPNTGTARILGVIIHFMMGAVFTLFYVFLWNLRIGTSTWLWGLIFGAVHGVLAMITMPMMIKMQPRPSQMDSGPMMMIGLMMGHLVLGWLLR